MALQSVPDAAPIVTLEGAPRRVLLLDENEDLAIKYEATDDHGSSRGAPGPPLGTREERRVLARLDGETTRSKGGQVLRFATPFSAKSHRPSRITVGRRTTIRSPDPSGGESGAHAPSARRGRAGSAAPRRASRLAWRDGGYLGLAPRQRDSAFGAGWPCARVDCGRRKAASKPTRRACIGHPGNVRGPARGAPLGAMLSAQSQKMRAAVTAEARTPSATTFAAR